MFVATVVLAVLVGGGFIAFGIGKLMNVPMMAEARDHLAIESQLFRAVGALEVLGGVGVLIGLAGPLTLLGSVAAVGLIAMTIGAVYYHQKADDSITDWLPAVVMGSLAFFYIILRIAVAVSG